MGALISTPKLPSIPKRGGKKGAKPAPKAKPTKKARGTKKAKPAKKARGTKKAKTRRSRYEEEPEQYANWAMALSPAAYAAVTGKIKKEKYEGEEEYETEEEYEGEEEYESEEEYEGEEEYEARHQVYTPADFSSVATPLNLSVVLMILLLVLIILARR